MSYSIHGMKTTLLPWGAQLGYTGVVTDGMRRLQGHHKPSQSSVSLYSRGDVGGQLEFHKRLVDQVKQGWRPITPQHRGSQAPCKEPNVEVEFFKKSPPLYVWKIVHFYSNTLQMFLPDAAPESHADANSSSASSIPKSHPTHPAAVVGPTWMIRRLRHQVSWLWVTIVQQYARWSKQRPIKNSAKFLDAPLKTGCGLNLTGDKISILEMSASLEGMAARSHRGRNKLIVE